MKKLMIIMLMGIILIIPFNTHASDNGHQYGLPTYQLDQKIPELNGHTLREVFEEGNLFTNYYIATLGSYNPNDNTYKYNNISGMETYPILYSVLNIGMGKIYIRFNFIDNGDPITNIFRLRYGSNNILLDSDVTFIRSDIYDALQSIIRYEFAYVTQNNDNIDVTITDFYILNLTDLGISHLTRQQMDYYYKYYQLALKYEEDNKEAVKDSGQYKHIFMSIYEGLTNLMRSMGSVWRFLTTPFVDTTLSDMDNLFSIDWSWDIFDVLRQWITNMAVWILQLNAVLIGTLFLILGIPIKVSILSLVFSDLVFVILGWIMIKSFII